MSVLNLMKYGSAATLSSLDTCDWEGTAYHRYPVLLAGDKYIHDTQSCLEINAMRAIIMDLDNNMRVDRCEWSLACIGTGGWGEVDTTNFTKDQWHALGEACAKHSVAFTWDDVKAACNEMY